MIKFVFNVFVSLLFVMTAVSSIAQENISSATPFAGITDDCREITSAVLDVSLVELSRQPQATGMLLVFQGGPLEGRNLSHLKALRAYLAVRASRPELYRLERSAVAAAANVKIFIVGDESARYEFPMFVAPDYKSETLFDVGDTEIRFDPYLRKPTYFSDGFSDLGCGFAPNISEYAAILKSRTDLKARIVFFGKPGKPRRESIKSANFAIREIVSKYGIRRNRLSLVAGGAAESPKVEFWLKPV